MSRGGPRPHDPLHPCPIKQEPKCTLAKPIARHSLAACYLPPPPSNMSDRTTAQYFCERYPPLPFLVRMIQSAAPPIAVKPIADVHNWPPRVLDSRLSRGSWDWTCIYCIVDRQTYETKLIQCRSSGDIFSGHSNNNNNTLQTDCRSRGNINPTRRWGAWGNCL